MYIMIGSLENLINIFSAAEWFWYGAGILGLIIMRITLPNKHRPFKVDNTAPHDGKNIADSEAHVVASALSDSRIPTKV